MKPAVRIQVDGVEKAEKLTKRLVSITINDEAGIRSDTCEIELDAGPDAEHGGIKAPAPGAEVRVWLGYEPEPAERGRFRVARWERSGPPNMMRISATAAELTSSIRATKVRSHHNTTVGAIVRKIAGEHGLGVEVDAAIAARSIPHIDQQTESDLGFLSRLAARNGATFKLGNGRILFAAKGSRLRPAGAEKAVIPIRLSDVSHWTASSDIRGDHKSVKCAYIEPGTRKRRYATAGAGEPVRREKTLYGSKAEAEAAAAAILGDLARGTVEVEIEGRGNPRLHAEALVSLSGFSPDVDGSYLAKSVTHSYSGQGYTTSVTLETEGAARAGEGD